MSEAAPIGPVLIVGAGLIGTSVGLALRRGGIDVHLTDKDDNNLARAESIGAGVAAPLDRPGLVVAAVPPDHLGETVVDALERFANAYVTDVGSVKTAPLAYVLRSTADLSRYVGGHPMAGSERSGPAAAAANLFEGRAWAVTPHVGARPEAVQAVRALATACGASPVELSPEDHDAAVAEVSHLPHLMAVLAAARLIEAPHRHLSLSGQGLRDVTRVAAGDPSLWRQIVSANSEPLRGLLLAVRDDVDRLLAGLEDPASPHVVDLLRKGAAGRELIPGKHGKPTPAQTIVYVAVPDRPGELARLFADAGQSGVNVEDLHIDHDPARPVGLVEIVVDASSAERLMTSLTAQGWSVHR
ncbi:MAG TPA: prephenate dehydrogenase [Nocardioidaceae bacterium]|nr:prephenate dehydrogenase [Nocardioidaceae bacterium]